MDEPKRGEVREAPGGRRYYVQGASDSFWEGTAGETRQLLYPCTDLIEVEGPALGTKFGVRTKTVSNWKVVSSPCQSSN